MNGLDRDHKPRKKGIAGVGSQGEATIIAEPIFGRALVGPLPERIFARNQIDPAKRIDMVVDAGIDEFVQNSKFSRLSLKGRQFRIHPPENDGVGLKPGVFDHGTKTAQSSREICLVWSSLRLAHVYPQSSEVLFAS